MRTDENERRWAGMSDGCDLPGDCLDECEDELIRRMNATRFGRLARAIEATRASVQDIPQAELNRIYRRLNAEEARELEEEARNRDRYLAMGFLGIALFLGALWMVYMGPLDPNSVPGVLVCIGATIVSPIMVIHGFFRDWMHQGRYCNKVVKLAREYRESRR